MTLENRASKRQKRQSNNANKGQLPNNEQRGLFLKNINPMTDNQERTFDAYADNKHLMLHGSAGTGKTFISLYLSLLDVMKGPDDFHKVVIIRSVVPTRDMGFLPGSAKEKSKVYEAPYYSICSEMFGRGDAYEILKTKNLIEFQTTSFIRGITLNDCIIVVDEMQNMTGQELDSIITRIGDNCKIIFCGDFRQTDLAKDAERRGLLDFMRIIKKMNAFEFVEFTRNDIVRSSLVKSYIITKEELDLNPH